MSQDLDAFRRFCEENKELLGVKSVIWKRLSQDFGKRTHNLRGYGVNNSFPDHCVHAFIRANSVMLFLIEGLGFLGLWTGRVAKGIWARGLSFIFFRNFTAVKAYSFKDYVHQDYMEYQKRSGRLTSFNKRQNKDKYGIKFSHHTFKLFCYLEAFHEACSDFRFEGKSVLEIGGGMLNFATLCFEETEELFYVCVDLPEMIEAVHSDLNEVLVDVECFLPHQMEAAFASKSKKRLLSLLPGQLAELDKTFDLFVNHESFAEMDLSTVQGYLESVSTRLSSGGMVFLVNRFFRVQVSTSRELRELSSIDQLTCFDNYKPTWCEDIVYTVEPFRQQIRTQNDRPNAFYIGCRK